MSIDPRAQERGDVAPRRDAVRALGVLALGVLALGALGIAGTGSRTAAGSKMKCGKSCPCRKHESKGKCHKLCKRKCDW